MYDLGMSVGGCEVERRLVFFVEREDFEGGEVFRVGCWWGCRGGVEGEEECYDRGVPE